MSDYSLPEWNKVELHNSLKQALLALEFLKPTGIQARSLPLALEGRDIVGVAETVSSPSPPEWIQLNP
jgi:ATP-dependent RNA helicase DDX24/MAK5